MTNLTQYRRFLRNNGYPIPADPRDVVHTVRAIMKARFPCGWREHADKYGSTIIHAPNGEFLNEPDQKNDSGEK